MKPIAKVSLLLFFSGLCALVYQLVWLREFRLIFGTSTAASAAVLGIFMGGLGLGSLFLGQRAGRAARPLAFYGRLEIGIALAAALTPVLFSLVRQLYIATGGTLAWGMTGGTLLRMLCTALVLGIPTFLMGGTLPAAARAVSRGDDHARSGLAWLYGANALGAVTGVLLGTFWLFERMGNFATLALACVANLAVAIVALRLARRMPLPEDGPDASDPAEAVREAAAPARFVYAAAAITGFSFLLLEMVWYRMLSPLLGGSTFTFGLILAAALLGMGLGGAANALFHRGRQATLHGFALTCAAEALFVALPFALGDRIAIGAALLQPFGILGFPGQVLAWSAITGLVVVPAAFVAGVQFPALISLLGRGGREIGGQVGRAYAWNMAGAIAGALAGGFGLLPLLTAPRTWQLVAALLVALGLVALGLSLRRERRVGLVWLPAGVGVAALALLCAVGPTAVWRHSAIGAGRAKLADYSTRNHLQAWLNETRAGILWQADGVESGVGVSADDGLAFLVNGKSDGSARCDAGTQVMCGLLGALLQEAPRQALVVGLGTGSTAGWLAAVPSMERVDVVELEPSILKVAELCAPVNHDALANPKLHVTVGDAREVILITRRQYDLIASEPSNPFRAGVASLFTREFYEAAAARLQPRGQFCQWVQAYEVDSDTIRTVYTTLEQVFPVVETWQTLCGDMLFVASKEPVFYDVAALRERVAREPYRRALAKAWRVSSLEGVFARYLANETIARQLARSSGARVNTDDHNLLEYAFARTVGRDRNFDVGHISRAARRTGAHRPTSISEGLDWARVDAAQLSFAFAEELEPELPENASEDLQQRFAFMTHFRRGAYREARDAWFSAAREPVDFAEMAVLAQTLAFNQDERAVELADGLRGFFPGEADAIVGILRWQQDRLEDATRALEGAFTEWRQSPWASYDVPARALRVAEAVADEETDPACPLAARLHAALDQPFSIRLAEKRRIIALLNIGRMLSPENARSRLLATIRSLEPNVPWLRNFLNMRAEICAETRDPLAARAAGELELFLRNDAQPNARTAAAAAGQSRRASSGANHASAAQADTAPRRAPGKKPAGS